MQTNFTPGPWEIDFNNDYLFIISTPANKDGVGDYIVDDRGLGPGEVLNCFANANLVAAAPDLYAALDAARRALIGVSAFNGMPYTDKINAALAKARGEK